MADEIKGGAKILIDADIAGLEQKVARATTRLNDLKARMRELVGASTQATYALEPLEIELQEVADETQRWEQFLEETVQELNQLKTASSGAASAVSKVEAAKGKATKATGSWSQAMTELSRGFEDWSTGGFMGALNNIPGIFSSVARAAGLAASTIAKLAGPVAAVATTAYLLYQNWDSVKTLWESKATETEADEMSRLADQTKRTADEEARYQELLRKRQTSEIKGAEEIKQAEATTEAGKAIEESISQAGGTQAVVAALASEHAERAIKAGVLKDDDGAARFAFEAEAKKQIESDLNTAITTGDLGKARGLTSEARVGSGAEAFRAYLDANDPQAKKEEARFIAQQRAQFEAGKPEREAAKEATKAREDETKAKKKADEDAARKLYEAQRDAIEKNLRAGGKFSTNGDEVSAALRQAGVNDSEGSLAKRMAGDLNARGAADLQQEALKRGLGLDDTQAAIKGELDSKQSKELAQEEARKNREAREKAEFALPGLEDRMAEALQSGFSPEWVKAQANRGLRGAGLSEEERARASGQLSDEAEGKAREGLYKQQLKDSNFQAQVLSMGRADEQLLTGGNKADNTPQKQLDELAKIARGIDQLVRNPRPARVS